MLRPITCKEKAWSYLRGFSENITDRKPNEAELCVECAGGRRVRIYGADYYDWMRRIYLDDVVLDEFADFRPAARSAIARSTSPLA